MNGILFFLSDDFVLLLSPLVICGLALLIRNLDLRGDQRVAQVQAEINAASDKVTALFLAAARGEEEVSAPAPAPPPLETFTVHEMDCRCTTCDPDQLDPRHEKRVGVTGNYRETAFESAEKEPPEVPETNRRSNRFLALIPSGFWVVVLVLVWYWLE